MAAWVVILVESVIMSICTDFSWLVAILVFQYCILIIIDSKHLLLYDKWRYSGIHNQINIKRAGSK